MNTHSIRHAWFPPTIPKRKHDVETERELDAESEWPSAYRALSGPGGGVESRPAKRLRGLEGGLAGLSLKHRGEMDVEPVSITLNTNPDFLSPNINTQPPSSSPPVVHNQIHDAPLDGDAEPYISSIYEWASPHTGVGSSVASLPLRGEVSEVNSSDSDDDAMVDDTSGNRMGAGVFVQGEKGTPGYTVYEPESGLKNRREAGDEEIEELSEKRGKRTWYEPEKDRIVVLDLDSSEDESTARSPRRRRSAFSLSSTQSSSPNRPRSQTEAPSPEFIINPSLLSHISPPGKGMLSIPREEDPAKAVVLFRPAPWEGGAPLGSGEEGAAKSPVDGDTSEIEEAKSQPVSMEASPLIQDDDMMDIDS